MRLIVTNYGDPSVGIFPQSWNVDVPFSKDEIDNLECFRETMLNTYRDYAKGKISAVYDFEFFKERGYYEWKDDNRRTT